MSGGGEEKKVFVSSPLTAVMEALKKLLNERGVKYLIVSGSDAHNSEYLAPQDKRRAFISGFDGSAGTALVGAAASDSYLWTDGRYWLQAGQQLDAKEWTLMKAGAAGVPTLEEKLLELLKKGDKLGVDPRLITVAEMRSYSQACEKVGATLEWCPGLVDQVWKDRTNGLENTPAVKLMPDSISGRSVADKLAATGLSMRKAKVDFLILGMLDEIAWLLNLRGADISFNPVFFSFAILSFSDAQDTTPKVTLFIDSSKIADSEVSGHLKAQNVAIEAYDNFYTHLATHLRGKASYVPRVWLDVSKSNAWTYVQLTSQQVVLENVEKTDSLPSILHEVRGPIADMKSTKNAVEIEGMRNAHLEDGAALVEFLSWLEATVKSEGYASNPLNERQVADKELEFRKKRKGFVGLSFETISSSGANAAIIHYSPPQSGSANVVREKIYLNDSGGQYECGTTDVTRTVHFGEPTEEERNAYTRVLIGFISLANAKFPDGISGFALDVLARNALWQAGMNYQHGTGHGVGHYLNVHEMPPYIGIFRGQEIAKLPIAAGMCTSIEPGYYEDGHFGIRIENVAVIVTSETKHTNNGTFLEFEQLTMAPIAKNLINRELLSATEIAWLNAYHGTVYQRLCPLLSPSALHWLASATSPL